MPQFHYVPNFEHAATTSQPTMDLQQLLDEALAQRAQAPEAKKKSLRQLNAATHAKLNRQESLRDSLSHMQDETHWLNHSITLLQLLQECRCGISSSSTAG